MSTRGERLIEEADTASAEETTQEQARADDPSSLELERALLHLILESAPDPIFLKDRAGHLLLANGAALRLIGQPWEAVAGRKTAGLHVSGELYDRIDQAQREAMETGRTVVIQCEIHLPGGRRWFRTAFIPWRVGDEVRGVGTIAHDVTAVVAAQGKLHELTLSLEQRVLERTRQLQEASESLVAAQERERRRVALELHDEAGQSLAGTLVLLQLLLKQAEDPEAVRQTATTLLAEVNRVATELHRISADLMPASLEAGGLEAALAELCRQIRERHGLPAVFDGVAFGDSRPPPAIELALYRIAQEALTNVVRHSHASRVDVLLTRVGRAIHLIVEDDGIGWAPELRPHRRRLGVEGMRERARAIGGTLDLESRPGGGTTLRVRVRVA